MRSWSARSSALSAMSFSLGAAGNQYRERVARTTSADGDFDAAQAGVLEELLQLFIIEAEPLVAEALADPLLLVAAQLQQQHAAAGFHDARGFRQRLLRG